MEFLGNIENVPVFGVGKRVEMHLPNGMSGLKLRELKERNAEAYQDMKDRWRDKQK